MLWASTLSLCKNRGVFDQPNFIGCFVGAVIGELLHGSPTGEIILLAQPANNHLLLTRIHFFFCFGKKLVDFIFYGIRCPLEKTALGIVVEGN